MDSKLARKMAYKKKLEEEYRDFQENSWVIKRKCTLCKVNPYLRIISYVLRRDVFWGRLRQKIIFSRENPRSTYFVAFLEMKQ